jgi:nucleoside-diphosphate kinase
MLLPCPASNLRMCQMSAAGACRLLSTQQGDPALAPAHLASGPVVAMELMAASGIRKWLDQADSIRGMLGTRAVLASDSPDSAAEELALFFGSSSSSKPSIAGSTQGSTAWGATGSSSSSSSLRASGRSASAGGGCGQSQVTSCCRGCGTTLGLVLPHAVKDGVAGLLLEEIQAGFDVTGLQLFNLPKQAAAEFLEVYKGVVPPGEFSAMVDELASGPCIAVEVSLDGEDQTEQEEVHNEVWLCWCVV